MGLGAGNLLAGMTGSFPVDSSPPRSAVLAESGGRSQLAGLVAVALTVGVVAFATGLLQDLPQDQLSAKIAALMAQLGYVSAPAASPALTAETTPEDLL